MVLEMKARDADDKNMIAAEIWKQTVYGGDSVVLTLLLKLCLNEVVSLGQESVCEGV